MATEFWRNVGVGAVGAVAGTGLAYGAMNYWSEPNNPTAAIDTWLGAKGTAINEYLSNVGNHVKDAFVEPTFWPVTAGIALVAGSLGWYWRKSRA